MRILITNHSLGSLGGTETWTLTMAQELEKLGHEVHLFAANAAYEISRFPRYDHKPYDLLLINHNICLEAFKNEPGLKIFTSHGIIPDLEQPAKGADIYVSVSEEVQANLKSKGFESAVIRNPIDLEKFRSFKPVNEKLANILFMSNYQGEARKVIEEACKELNLRIWGKNNPTSDVVSEMNWADLVIGLGRTAYEAMACERNVIIYDYNGSDGYMTAESLVEARKNNCSGRRYGQKLTPEELKSLFKLYDPTMGQMLRQFIKQNNDIKLVAQQYLELKRRL